MQVEIGELEPRKAVCVSHRGPYFMIGQTCMRLGEWLKEAGQWVCLYYDDPEATPAAELRSDAGVFVPNDFVSGDPRVHVVDIAGGPYAIGTHVGPYDGLPNAWGEIVGKWLPSSGYAFGDSPGFEVYLDDCADVPASLVRTEVCLPVKAPAGSGGLTALRGGRRRSAGRDAGSNEWVHSTTMCHRRK